jgi:hypothetical protein
MADKRDRLIAQFAARNRKRKPPRITEDDPRWVQQLAHGQGQERKVGANVTVPRAYVTGGSRRGRMSRGT